MRLSQQPSRTRTPLTAPPEARCELITLWGRTARVTLNGPGVPTPSLRWRTRGQGFTPQWSSTAWHPWGCEPCKVRNRAGLTQWRRVQPSVSCGQITACRMNE